MIAELVRARVANMPAERLIALWLSGRTKRTLETYRADLNELARHLGQTDTAKVAAAIVSSKVRGTTILLEWRAAMLDKGLAPATINRRLSAVRSLIHLARVTGHIEWTVEVPNVPARSYRDVTGPGLNEIREFTKRLAMMSDRSSIQTLALVRLMFDLGLRRIECCRLTMEDVSILKRLVYVIGKGKREKVAMRLPAATSKALSRWMRKRGRHPGYLFPTRKGEQLDPAYINSIIEQSCERVGVDKIRCHGLRHSAITALAGEGYGLADLASFGRWANAGTASHYLDAHKDAPGKMAKVLSEKV